MEPRSIAITGGASGIGRSTARLFAENGWVVGIYDRDAAAVEQLCAEPLLQGAVAHAGDVADDKSLAKWLKRLSERSGGKVDVLFNSAGLLQYGDFADVPKARKQAIVDVNILGVMNAIDAALPLLERAADARIVTMSSAGAIYGYPRSAIYSASKFFVRGLTEALNIELRGKDIWACDIMVGFVDTEMVRDPQHGDLITTFNVTTQPEAIASILWQACSEKRVHWMADDNYTAPYASAIDVLPWNERHHYVRGMLG